MISLLVLAGIIAMAILLNPSIESDKDPAPAEGTDAAAPLAEYTMASGAVPEPTRPTGAVAPLADFAITSATVIDPTLPVSSIEVLPTQPNADSKSVDTARTISVAVEPTASEAFQRLSSIKDVAAGGLTGGRQTHWKVSWIFIRDHPWFEFDTLSLRWLRPLVGYRPDLFRYTYLLESPPEGTNFFPLERDHAHNYFIHQTVEQGFLGTLSSLGVFAAVFLAAAYQLIRSKNEMSPMEKLILITLLSVMAGRALEMMVGVARVSDLTVFWVLLGMFAALPLAAMDPQTSARPTRPTSRRRRPNSARASSFPGPGGSDRRWLWRLALVTWPIGVILVLTWMKGISYPLAAVQIGNALEHSRQGNLPSTLDAIDRAIGLAPDVPVYYNWRASVYKAYRREPRIPREQRCNFQDDVSYEVCLAALTHESNLTGSKQRPFYYRSRIAVAGSALNLRLDDEAIRYYQESLDLVPSSWALRDNLASALIQQEKPGDALGLLQESLEITNGADASINALALRGRAYLELGRHLEAIDDLSQLLEIDSSDAQAHAIRALAYTNLGQDAQASEDVGRVAELGANPTELKSAIDQIKKTR